MLEMYTVYNHPRDYPDTFVVKKWICEAGNPPVQDTSYVFTSQSLQKCREEMQAKGLICIGRETNDDPVIEETWM
jgi:hypothetical protein